MYGYTTICMWILSLTSWKQIYILFLNLYRNLQIWVVKTHDPIKKKYFLKFDIDFVIVLIEKKLYLKHIRKKVKY